LSLILDRIFSEMEFQVFQKNAIMSCLNSLAVLKYLLLRTHSFITFQSRSMGFRFGLYDGIFTLEWAFLNWRTFGKKSLL
jgi:hypothetical protein